MNCDLCHHRCKLTENSTGFCKSRKQINGQNVDIHYGHISAIHLDPIEKKPLYQFHPGSSILSIGFIGCNLACPFCQNYSISMQLPSYQEMSPKEVLETARLHSSSIGIAYTYSEPLIHFEYLLECAGLIKQAGLKNVLVSNGTINNDKFNKLLPQLDAANIDLKSWNSDFYKSELKGNKELVLQNLKDAAAKIHLEVTTLIIPEKNDSADEMKSIASFIKEINPKIPLHLSCYYPVFKYTIEPPSRKKMLELKTIAEKYLTYVYLGNMHLAR